jgi:hypothetical protein
LETTQGIEYPPGAGGKQIDTGKQSAVSQHATAGEGLREASVVELAQMGQDSQKPFGLRGKIKTLIVVMIINPAKAVTVIKENDPPLSKVYEKACKPPI